MRAIRALTAPNGTTFIAFMARRAAPGHRNPPGTSLPVNPKEKASANPLSDTSDTQPARELAGSAPRPERHLRPGPRNEGPHFPMMPMIYAMLASLVSAGVLAWYFSRPIRSLKQAFNAAASGKLDTRVAPSMGSRKDELTGLAGDFDRMAAHLHTLIEGQRRLLHDVSHELRSPLARLEAAVGLLRQRPDKFEAALARIERESMRMDELIGGLLKLSRLEAGVDVVTTEELNVTELVADIVDDARFEGTAQGKAVLLHDSKLVRISGNPELLHSAIENVVRNAIHYSTIRRRTVASMS